MRLRVVVALLAAWLPTVETIASTPAEAQDRATDSTRPPPAGPNVVRVHLVANEANIQFWLRDVTPGRSTGPRVETMADSHSAAASCAAPCDVFVAPGDYRVALARIGGKAVDNDRVVEVRGPTAIAGTYQSHSAERAAGVTLLSALLSVGLLIAAVGSHQSTTTTSCTTLPGVVACLPHTTTESDGGLIAGGLVVAALGVGIGVPLALVRDGSKVELVPLEASRTSLPSSIREPRTNATGLGLRVVF
jgi:hypothetical protein